MYFVNGYFGSHGWVHEYGATGAVREIIPHTSERTGHIDSNLAEKDGSGGAYQQVTEPGETLTSAIKRLPGRRCMPVQATM
jgi:hypothetical protein